MNHDAYVNSYLSEILASSRNVAVVGASTNDHRPSHWICGFLLGKGYRVFPVNPGHAGETLLGQKVYATLADIADPIDLVDVFRRSQHLGDVVDQVLALKPRPKAIWGQLGVRDDAAAARAESAGIKMVMNRSLVSEYPLVYELTHHLEASGDRSAHAA
ncbi:CoA-binding protein [Rhizobium sp. SL42]|uniref:CoA-binding protein n=1 Tax=Rhizobium sp. SL42 TaxID=2806346 RepID=UPI001F313AE9|nr:CoA-binding protein [Rhizobium sp. SL42]UJW73294.1 CoA-binding protein [Rhizobium sp. SL42]